MILSQHIPWQVKIGAKLVLSRLPFDYRVWKRLGAFKNGPTDQPDYAFHVFRRHFDAVDFPRKRGDFVVLELGPGDSLFSALIALAYGAASAYLVDVGHFESTDLSRYREMESYLLRCGLHPPNLENCASFEELKTLCSAQYLTKGLASLRSIPSDSVDFIWSHAVLEHVRRDEFMPTLVELRRIQRRDGVSSHCISITDILGANLNDLRFSDRIWESSFMANSGFYTNRIRYTEMLQLFRRAGFEPEVRRVQRWRVLPTPRRKMARQFATLPEEELRVSGFDVTLH